MTDKELIKKLNLLKSVQPDSSWKKENRDILLAQISNAVAAPAKIGVFDKFVYDFKNLFAILPRAAWGIICLALILTGGTFSAYAANNAKPGDYFYAAKIWKEKIQLAITFNQEEKAKLDMKLASIHAKEISEVLADPNFNNKKGNEKKAEKLAQNFRAEINTVKERLSEISNIEEKKSSDIAETAAANIAAGMTGASNDDVKVGIGDINKDTDGKVHSVESVKDAAGIQIYDPNAKPNEILNSVKVSTSAAKTLSGGEKTAAASTSAPAAAASTTSVSVSITDTLDKATESFNTKDFNGAKDMLEQVGTIIANIDSGTVKGIVESGTSTAGGDASSGAIGSSSNK
jgi:hypothetical protein